ncbi:MAG: hypothetical protein EB117_09115 [Betaproteobacteria bacterium]|nr:hypothetical protein [Betaproteobacteria bacterium]
MGEMGNLIMASEYIKQGNDYVPVGALGGIVDGKKLKPKRWYIVEGGEWVEVDFTDGFFTYVLSNRNGVKKVRDEKGNVFYIVSDENGNSAHGKTIKEAREDLVYKVTVKFDGKVPDDATGKEWIGLYRAITGACSAGIKSFVEGTGKSLDDVYTKGQICELIKGKFGEDKFLSACKKK